MQVFLPVEDFFEVADILDKKRLFKQVVETRQILATNGIRVPKKDCGYVKPTHVNHPIHKMWNEFTDLLMIYHDILLNKCLSIGIKTTLNRLCNPELEIGNLYHREVTGDRCPRFLGNKDFHASHRSNLLRKNPEYYGQFGWEEPDDLPYLWEF